MRAASRCIPLRVSHAYEKSTLFLTPSSLAHGNVTLHAGDVVEIGDRIKQRREALGITQDQLADALGIAREAVSQWETGETKPRYKRLRPLADVLKCSVNHLTGGTDNAMPEDRLLRKYRALSDADRETVDIIIERLSGHTDPPQNSSELVQNSRPNGEPKPRA